MADNLTVRTGGSAAPASGSANSTGVKSKLDEQVAQLGALIKQRTGRDANEDMLRGMVLRKTAATERADAADKSRKEFEANTSKEGLQKRVVSDERAALTGRLVETPTKDGLSNEQRKMVAGDPNAPVTLPPATTPQITAKQAEALLEHMFAYVATDSGALKVEEYAKTLTPRPASAPGDSAKTSNKAIRAETGAATAEQNSSASADRSTTGQSVVTKPTTAQEPKTSRLTTEQTTAGRSTTEQSTTGKSTAEQSTAGRSTTEQSTTGRLTTEQSTTRRLTTEQRTTDTSAGDQPTVSRQSAKTTETATRSQQQTNRATAQLGATASALGGATQLDQTTIRSTSTSLGTTVHSKGTERSASSSSATSSTVANRSAGLTTMAAEGSGSAATRLSLRSGRSSTTKRTATRSNGGGGIDTTTSWDGMHFNWEAFFIRFLFKYQEDESEARRLMKELRNSMHKLAQEGIRAKIAIEKMNQAFERAEKAFEIGSALKELVEAPAKDQAAELFGNDTAALIEPRPGGRGNIDRQMEEIVEKAGVTPSTDGIYLTQSQRNGLRDEDRKRYENLLKERLKAAGTMGEQAIIKKALLATQAKLGAKTPPKEPELETKTPPKEPELEAKTPPKEPEKERLQKILDELYLDNNARNVSVQNTMSAANASQNGRGTMVDSSNRLHEGLVKAAQLWIKNDGQGPGALERIVDQSVVYANNMLVTPNPDDGTLDRQRRGEYDALAALGSSQANLEAAREEQLARLDTDLKEGEFGDPRGLEGLRTGLQLSPELFNQALAEGFNAQISRTYAAGKIPTVQQNPTADAMGQGLPASLTGPQPNAEQQRLAYQAARTIGGHLAGEAVNQARKDHVTDIAKKEKTEKMIEAGISGLSNISETLRRDLEKVNAEVVSSAQRGASEVNSRIRSSYMQAQGLFNQMVQLLAMSRSR